MKAPDKIYVPIVNLGIEEGEHPAPLWWNKDKKSEHPDVVGTIEYIHKDALLEWASNLYEKTMTFVTGDATRDQAVQLFALNIKKHIESL